LQNQYTFKMRVFLTAQEAAETLGITRATLYAYTSRGQLISEPVPGTSRERRYRQEDIIRLQRRKAGRRDPDKAVEQGLYMGSPLLTSSITLIDGEKLYYRGKDALELARHASLEEVARLLWTNEGNAPNPFAQARPIDLDRILKCTAFAGRHPLSALQVALPLIGAADPAAWDLRPAAVRKTGERILRALTAVVSGVQSAAPVHEALQTAWTPRNPGAGDAIRTALVLCADHELNVSAFTARCAASAGASPYDTVAAAMATLKGTRHGGQTERVAALLAEASTPKRAREAMEDQLRQAGWVSGFGHPLYPGGDPRARALLRCAYANGDASRVRSIKLLAKIGMDLLKEEPNLDFGLAAIASAYKLPGRAPLCIFALGRTAGWIAHSMEQYATGDLIRPRARYGGLPPASQETKPSS
jgi:citrate synthase